MNKSRVEAITDGIIAIAATIMVLELGVPATNEWSGLVELRHTFLAYANSFFMIYLAWLMHHDLFVKVDTISRRGFMINGFWIFCLTLVPFTTSWVGASPNDALPEFFYPLNLMLWRAAFQWLDFQIRKENSIETRSGSTKPFEKIARYVMYAACMVIAFIKPILSIYIIGTSTVVMIVRFFIKDKADE